MLNGLMRLEDRIVFSADPAPDADNGDAGDSAKRVLLVDRAVQDAEALARAAGNDNNRVEVLFYDSRTDSLDSIQSMLRDFLGGMAAGTIDSIAFAGYGEAGSFGLAADATLDLASLGLGSDLLAFFNSIAGMDALSDQFRIDLLGCDIAAGPDGQLLIAKLEELTGIDFAASSDRTGSEKYNGNWILETDNVDARADYFNDSLDSADPFDAFNGWLDEFIYFNNKGNADIHVAMRDFFKIYDNNPFFGSGGLEVFADALKDGGSLNIDLLFRLRDGSTLPLWHTLLDRAVYQNYGNAPDTEQLTVLTTTFATGSMKVFYKGVHVAWLSTNDANVPGRPDTTDQNDYYALKFRKIQVVDGELEINGIRFSEITKQFVFPAYTLETFDTEGVRLAVSALKYDANGNELWYESPKFAKIEFMSPNYEHVLFINSKIKDYAALANAVADNVKVYFYDGSAFDTGNDFKSMVEKMLSDFELYTSSVLRSIGIVSAGTAGELFVASGQNIPHMNTHLTALFQSIKAMDNAAPDLRVDLLASNVFASDAALAYLATMKSRTGLDFAGSTNQTGNTVYGADWIMEAGTADGYSPIDVTEVYFRRERLESSDSSVAFDSILDGKVESMHFGDITGTAVLSGIRKGEWRAGDSLFGDNRIKFFPDALPETLSWDLSFQMIGSGWDYKSIITFIKNFQVVESAAEVREGIYAVNDGEGVNRFSLYVDGYKIGTLSGGATIEQCHTISFAKMINKDGKTYVVGEDASGQSGLLDFEEKIAPQIVMDNTAIDSLGLGEDEWLTIRFSSSALLPVGDSTAMMHSRYKVIKDDSGTDPEPVDPNPVDPEPVDPNPVDPEPVDPNPVDPEPVDPTPENPTPVDPTPEAPEPVNPTPEQPSPVDPIPENPPPLVDPTPTTPLPGNSAPSDVITDILNETGNNTGDLDQKVDDINSGEAGSSWNDFLDDAEQKQNGGGDGGGDDKGNDDSAKDAPVLGSDLVADLYGNALGMEAGDSYRNFVGNALQSGFGGWLREFSGDDRTPDEVFRRLDDMLSHPGSLGSTFSQDDMLSLGETFQEIQSSLDIINRQIEAVHNLLAELDSSYMPPELVKWIKDGIAQARVLVEDAAASVAAMEYAVGLARNGNTDLMSEGMVREIHRFMARVSRELRLVSGGLSDFVKLVEERRDQGEIDGSGILTRINRNQALRWVLLTREAERRDGFHVAVQKAGLVDPQRW